MKNLKLALLGTVFAFGAATAANAADIYEGGGSLKDEPIVYMPPMTWTGFYFGAHVGATFDDSESCDYVYSVKSAQGRKVCEDEDTAWLGGIQAGYNWQKDGPLVLGVEGDISFADEFDYLASIRGRIGYALGDILLYGTGGIAFLGVEEYFGDDETFTGWVAGLGADYKIAQNMSVGLEGLYYNFEESDLGDGADDWVVRARLNYHLNEAYPEALK